MQAGGMSTPAGVEADYPLARLTTIRTGGQGDFFARPDNPEALAGADVFVFKKGDSYDNVFDFSAARVTRSR